ncbi:hypothetical protein TNCV_4593741 [Trichonephila clavipes]|uniref:Uncharacterized protein n=1 Tax=Trichonephila clavipes TaxID=2585209 RepID=A0A8X7BKG3_TRICX|nr:hypothetical protein TNCV_4593741 [Trichonephila clavipes]
MAFHVTRPLTNKARFRRAWKAIAAVPKIYDITAKFQRLWHDLPQVVIGVLTDSMPSRVSAYIVARGGFTTY